MKHKTEKKRSSAQGESVDRIVKHMMQSNAKKDNQ